MFTPGTCPSCSKPLPAVADVSGLCEECLRSTDRTSPTAPELLPTVSAAVADNAGTVTFFPSGGTHSVPTDAPDPVVVSARMTRLRNGGWLDVRRCGGGGMGELFAGFDPGLQQQVVAKFIRRDAISDSTRDRFRVEAATLARLVHKNVARLFAYSEGDDPYLVMEYVDGGTLSEWIRRGALPAREAAAILEGVARGVAAAHAGGVVHRDLKPSNVLLDRTGPAVVPKVTDFGMAKDADAVEPLTGPSAVLGTPEFMSPEQAARRSATCDARSDVWGLAATLYTAVTGHPPYTRDLLNPPVLTDPLTPPTAHTPDLPADLTAVITMGLEKHPNDRYQTAVAFADDLKRFLAGEPVLARRRAWPIRSWRRAQRVSTGTAVAVLFAVVALTAVGATYFGRAPSGEVKIARKMADFEAGKEITVIPETGLPDWHETLVGSATPITTREAGGATVVGSLGESVVAFTRPLQCDAYELTLDLLEVRGLAVQGANQLAVHRFGPIFGLRTIPAPEGPVTAGWCVLYHDTNRGAEPPHDLAHAVFGHGWFSQRLKAKPAASQRGVESHPFHPSRPLGGLGRWRPHRFEVSPGGIRAFWRDDDGAWACYADVSAKDLNVYIGRCTADYQSVSKSDVRLPDWSPRGAVGLVVDKAEVGVRNVVLRPK